MMRDICITKKVTLPILHNLIRPTRYFTSHSLQSILLKKYYILYIPATKEKKEKGMFLYFLLTIEERDNKRG